jgi:hypothetical protein
VLEAYGRASRTALAPYAKPSCPADHQAFDRLEGAEAARFQGIVENDISAGHHLDLAAVIARRDGVEQIAVDV